MFLCQSFAQPAGKRAIINNEDVSLHILQEGIRLAFNLQKIIARNKNN